MPQLSKRVTAASTGTLDASTPQPAEVDVKAIRRAHPRFQRHMPVTQAAFAELYGFSAATVRDWEQGRRKPDALAGRC